MIWTCLQTFNGGKSQVKNAIKQSFFFPFIVSDDGAFQQTIILFTYTTIWAKSKTFVFATDGICVTFSVVIRIHIGGRSSADPSERPQRTLFNTE